MNKILLNEQNRYPYKMATAREKAHGLLKLNRICRLSETSELSTEGIHRHVHQFVLGTRNLW